MGLGTIPQGLCAYITDLYLINCISHTAVRSKNTDCTQKGVFKKNSFGYTELGSMMCVCVFVPNNKQENAVL